MIMEIAAIIVSTIIFLLMMPDGRWGGLAYIADLPTLVCMLILILPVLLKEGLAKDCLRAFKLLDKKYTCSFSELRHALDVVEMMQKQILCSGCIVAIQSFFLVFRMLSDMETIGPNLSVALLAILYTAIFELLMLPLQIEAKKRIVDYMEQDAEEAEQEQDTEKV